MNLADIYRRAFAEGATDAVEITSGDGARVATDVPAKVTGHGSSDLVGAVEASSFSVLVLAAALDAYGEPRDGDVLVMRGRRYSVAAVDPHARSRAGVTLCYRLDVRA